MSDPDDPQPDEAQHDGSLPPFTGGGPDGDTVRVSPEDLARWRAQRLAESQRDADDPPIQRTVPLTPDQMQAIRTGQLGGGRPASVPPTDDRTRSLTAEELRQMRARREQADSGFVAPPSDTATPPLDPPTDEQTPEVPAGTRAATVLERAGIVVAKRDDASVSGHIEVPRPPNWAIGGSLLLLGIIPGLIYLFVTRKPMEQPYEIHFTSRGETTTFHIDCDDATTSATLRALLQGKLGWSPLNG